MRAPLRNPFLLALASASFIFTVTPARAGTPPTRLDDNGGRVLGNPAIHNLYMTFDWDGNNPAAISSGAIDGFTQTLVNGSYFSSASQYGVGQASFTGSDGAFLLCPPPIIAGITDFFAITAWMQCETLPGDPIIRQVISGIPKPDGNTLYAVYLDTGTQINDILISTCGSFGAYHFFGETLVWDVEIIPLPPFVVPFLRPQSFPYTVIPTACASSPGITLLDGVTALSTHELIEAVTDPIILTGWIDNSNFGFNGDILTKGEAADICELNVGAVPSNLVRMADGLLVSPYWSNAGAGACVPITRTFHLAQTGLPVTVAREAQFDGSTVALPFDAIVDDGTTHSYSFPSPVNDPNPGIRYVTAEPPATFVVTNDFSKTAAYTTQYFLDVQTVPPAAAPLDVSLTPSVWLDSGTVVTLSTDPLITLGPDSRYRFVAWSGDLSSTSPSTAIAMTAPTSAIANYALQYLVTVSTSGLGANVTHILNGGAMIGTANDVTPLVVYLDAGPLALGADANVIDANGTVYFFQGFTPAAPTTLAGPLSTVAVYKTMAQLIQDALASGGIYGPGAAGLAKSLLAEFAAVQADMAAGRYAAAVQDLQAFISLLQAQTGVHVTAALASQLELDALLVLHDALCLGVAAGQINPTAAANVYAYYSNLVTLLGGIVLPAC